MPARFGEARDETRALLGRSWPALVEMLERGDARVRDAWLEVVARWPDAVPEPERVRTIALRALEETGEETRGALLVLALEGLGTPTGAAREAVGPSLARLVASPSPDIRAVLARTLAAWGDAAAQAMLVELAQDPVPLVRIAVAQAIAERRLLVGPALTADLFDLVRDPLPDVSVAAVQAILAQDKPELVSRLGTDPTPHVQRALRDRR